MKNVRGVMVRGLIGLALAAGIGLTTSANAQHLTLHCTGVLTVTALASGASSSESYEETFHFEKGRRDGLIPYEWRPESIRFESRAQFQHAGIVVESYRVDIRRSDYGILKVERLSVTPPEFEISHAIERRFEGRCTP